MFNYNKFRRISMKLFDEWKLKRECQKLGHENEYNDYKKTKEVLSNDKTMYEGFLKKAEENLARAKELHGEDTLEYSKASDEVNRWKYNLEQLILKAQFIRPNNPSDISYRKNIIDEFSDKIASILGDDTTIRFHGTTIYYAKEILKNNGISSSSSRYDGYDSSTDLEDEISVTTPSTINRTLSFFTDLYAFQSSLPAGCLFVLRTSDEDQELTKYAAMKSFNFKNNPERFLGVCTTSENIPKVREWLKEYGYEENLVFTFDEFLAIAHKFKIDKPDTTLASEVSSEETLIDAEGLIKELDDENIDQTLEVKSRAR